MLPALTGAVGRPGGGFVYLNGPESRGIDDDYVTASHLAVDERPSISQMDLVSTLEDPDRSGVLFCWNINIVASNPQQTRLREVLKRDDLFTVAIDLFPTDTTDLADVILPAASFLECDDIVVPYFQQALSAQVAALEPPGEAMPNPEVFRRIASALGFTEPELFESDEDILATVLERTGFGISFDELASLGTYWPDPVQQFADLDFPSPSGHIEIASASAQADGLPLLPQPWADEAPTAGQFRLLSPASHWAMNTEFGNDPQIIRRQGPLSVTIHPLDAEQSGLAPESEVLVSNAEGSLRAILLVSEDVPRTVALIPKGRFLRNEPGGANVNVLNPGASSDMGESSAVHGIEISISAIVRPS
jgi:anaerobic selenocysteine-containing dehydrogenase